ncbi:MAG: aspartyl/asparaginyl beta-hydroxylase domain-containing protein [Synechococcaceae cyanobacterium]|nr:aspartyl/asparaginyl beta-hydroxylase domain-containing protein [Synechococcaceae cyanobacterium]
MTVPDQHQSGAPSSDRQRHAARRRRLPRPLRHLAQEIGRGWQWVVFVWRMLGRLGGPRQWFRALATTLGLMRQRHGRALPELRHEAWFYDPRDFPFTQVLQRSWPRILEELQALRSGDFIAWPEKYLYEGKGWDTFGLFALGVPIARNCELCPETAAALRQIPGLVSAGFSSLAPGTHIAPHTGYPDGLLRCHLGLIVPESCGLRVASEVRSWRPGECLVFDDTAEHEAWNRSDRTRVVLLLDFRPQPSDPAPLGTG